MYMYKVAYVKSQAVMSLYSLGQTCKNVDCEGIRINVFYPAGGRRETTQTMRPFVAYTQNNKLL